MESSLTGLVEFANGHRTSRSTRKAVVLMLPLHFDSGIISQDGHHVLSLAVDQLTRLLPDALYSCPRCSSLALTAGSFFHWFDRSLGRTSGTWLIGYQNPNTAANPTAMALRVVFLESWSTYLACPSTKGTFWSALDA